MKRIYYIFALLLWFNNLWSADTLTYKKIVYKTIKSIDSVQKPVVHIPNILDTLKNPDLMRKIFYANEKISGYKPIIKNEKFARDLPRLKAIKIRPENKQIWKFWIILILVFYIGLIRLLNIKRFEDVMVSVFEIHSFDKYFREKGSDYLITAIGLYFAFVVSVSLFIVSFLEKNNRYETDNFFQLFLWIILYLIIIYAFKVLINILIAGVFKMRKMAILIILNMIFINIFLGIILLTLTVVYIYIPGSKALEAISAISFMAIIAALIYRLLKNILMAPKVSKYPIIYLFLYLCAFEIFPWLVVFKLFLNSW